MIHIRLDDGVYAKETLEEICSEPFFELGDVPISENSCFFKVSRKGEGLTHPRQAFEQLRDNHSTLVYANLPHPHMEMLDLGAVAAPSSLLKKHLVAQVGKEKIDAAVATLGGLTLKDAVNVTKIAKAWHGNVDSGSLVATRRALIKTSRGLSLVDTAQPSYVPDPGLAKLIAEEKDRFLHGNDWRLRPRGLLFDGVPGSGKTSGSKYIASEWGIPLFRLDETFQEKWVGSTGENFEMALRNAEAGAPCVLLIDECEKLFAGVHDGGAYSYMAQTMGSLLWWLQEHRARVLTVLTTNRKKYLPPELYREGRIDATFEIPPLQDQKQVHAVARSVWESFVGKDKLMPDSLIEKLPKSVKVDWKSGDKQQITPMTVTAVVTNYVKSLDHGGSK